ncbi:hypothetical protein ED208_14295 [Stagnimonas aquatica]|uniref:Uncharacterized protein n=1 Tax=Stagnimonas aquatica TaxID=2689987 RepID=A0A3N0V509_9GAMM|nr:PA2778 family cysteine peptidase [Stagnimonas aquatica]ROH87876.1 hypothetical protein ED208_14295 [Stagnimonas aquatica]
MDLRPLWLALGLTLAGCAALPPSPVAEAVQLVGVPAHAQEELQCGPAALSSALQASGVETSPEALKKDLFIPARGGSLQVELLAQTRRHGRLPVQLPAEEAALIAALRDGLPPLVLLNLGVRSYPVWHYAVLVGYDPEQGYLLNDGKAEPSRYSRRSFLRRWDWAGRWALLVSRPEQIPEPVRPPDWIAAAAPLERSAPPLAATAYRVAAQRWPEQALVQAALGAERYAAGDLAASVQALRKAVALEPDNAAYANNLANVEWARGCATAARTALAKFDLAALPPALAASLGQTIAEISAAPAAACPDPAAP